MTIFANVWGQTVAPRGLTIKPTASDYEFSGNAGKAEIGATYMGRSFSAEDQLHDSGNYIVVEVGVFAGKTYRGDLNISDFHLKLNGGRTSLSAAAPGLVAYALRNRDSDPRQKRLIYGGGMNGRDIMVGLPRPQLDLNSTNWNVVIESSLVEGPLQSGRAGNLFFEYSGKMSKVKSLVLEYEGAGGKLEIKLR